MKILTINPGSTSTKIAIYENDLVIFYKNLNHSAEDLKNFKRISEQYEFRKEIIYEELKKTDIDLESIRVIVGRGGMLKPLQSGVYVINEQMKKELMSSKIRQHASNLGALIADSIASKLPSCKAYIADPVVVDELDDLARVSGHPLFKRISIFHALNHKAVARIHAKISNCKYEDLNLIIVHMGGGITVGVHHKGRVVDVNQGIDGEGAFTPERSGTLPPGDVIRICFEGKYAQEEILKMITGQGGFAAYLGTNNALEVEEMITSGNVEAERIFKGLAYQVSKEIGAAATVLKGEIDFILLTGGLAYSEKLVKLIVERVKKIAPVVIYPGENEMKALALNGLQVLKGELEPKEYGL